MYELDTKRNEIESYIIKLIIGLGILGFTIYIHNYVETNDFVNKTQNMGGSYHSFDLFYYAFQILGFCASIIMILPSLVLIIRKLISK